MVQEEEKDIATLGGGCFWCLEAIYDDVQGIEEVESGYAGGNTENPTYEEVCTGRSGHAEVVQVHFKTDIISYGEILEIFFNIHDPTQLNRQGNDVGTQYRSVIFYHSYEQKEKAEEMIALLQKVYKNNPIVTEIVPFKAFYRAEDYHQNYYQNNPTQPYCNFIIAPKISKFRQEFDFKLKI